MNAFVATLGYSRRLFVKVYAQETQTEWFDGMEATFAHFGGVPKTILMDNAKALITTPRSYDAPALFNERLHAFARYWGFTARTCWPYRVRVGTDGPCKGKLNTVSITSRTTAWRSGCSPVGVPWIAIWRLGRR